jgi:hypothetical protein
MCLSWWIRIPSWLIQSTAAVSICGLETSGGPRAGHGNRIETTEWRLRYHAYLLFEPTGSVSQQQGTFHWLSLCCLPNSRHRVCLFATYLKCIRLVSLHRIFFKGILTRKHTFNMMQDAVCLFPPPKTTDFRINPSILFGVRPTPQSPHLANKQGDTLDSEVGAVLASSSAPTACSCNRSQKDMRIFLCLATA